MPLERDARAFGYEERAELGKHGRAGGGEEPFVAGRDHPVDYRGGRRKNDVIDAAAAASVAALAGGAGVLHRPPPQRGRNVDLTTSTAESSRPSRPGSVEAVMTCRPWNCWHHRPP